MHVDGAAAEAKRLVARGLVLEAEFLDPQRGGTGRHISRQVFYLRDPLGFRIEVVDVSRRPYLERWLAGEAYPAA
ncbi:MAG: hypothetical protein M3N29_09840 [Chloroflexota bacterium]|nr:hypothetical protein [Chloroflexota bacterium]